MAEKNDATLKPEDREFVITRVFDAPRALVFKAWTDPKQMARSLVGPAPLYEPHL